MSKFESDTRPDEAVSLSAVRWAVLRKCRDADELGAAYLRQTFPPRSNDPEYVNLVNHASGIDYSRTHHVEVTDADLGVIDLSMTAAMEERSREYGAFVEAMDAAVGGVAVQAAAEAA